VAPISGTVEAVFVDVVLWDSPSSGLILGQSGSRSAGGVGRPGLRDKAPASELVSGAGRESAALRVSARNWCPALFPDGTVPGKIRLGMDFSPNPRRHFAILSSTGDGRRVR
jgi:hypothetical protein